MCAQSAVHGSCAAVGQWHVLPLGWVIMHDDCNASAAHHESQPDVLCNGVSSCDAHTSNVTGMLCHEVSDESDG